MSVNVLLDKAQRPSDNRIRDYLGTSFAFFDELRVLTSLCDQDWRHYGKKYGWKLKVHADDKTLFELTIADGWFLVGMAIRDKERQDLATNPTSEPLAAIARASAGASEGYVIQIEVRSRASCDQAKALAAFIMAKRSLI